MVSKSKSFIGPNQVGQYMFDSMAKSVDFCISLNSLFLLFVGKRAPCKEKRRSPDVSGETVQPRENVISHGTSR